MISHPRSPGIPHEWVLAALLALVPFEARRAVASLGPFTVTVLEAAALAATAVLLWRGRPLLRSAVAGPVAWLGALAGAHLLSAALAADHPFSALKFALRMGLAAAFAAAVAVQAPETIGRALRGLVLGAVAVAVLSVAEGGGARFLDPALDLFREQAFHVGGARRASGGSEYPNLAAALLMCGLVTVAGLRASAPIGPGLIAVLAVLTAGLLFTYSRAALLAALAGLVVLAAVHRGRVPRAGLAVVAAGAILFTLGQEAFALRLTSEGVESWYGAEYAPAASRLRLRPGEATVTEVRVTNRGRLPWTREGLFHLSYHWYDVERRDLADGGRTRLPGEVGPGETVVLQAEVQAPARPGRYLLLWDMVQEHTSWFSGQGVTPGVVPAWVGREIGPGDEALASLLPAGPPAWRPGRRALWPLAWRMWRDHPWLGVGPDNFRRLYGRWAGKPDWDSRVYSNNAYLEAAATTGILGLAAFVGALASAGRVAWTVRHAHPLAPTLLGLLTALAVHGTADYVLAFTGHYLVFALAVGAAAALARR